MVKSISKILFSVFLPGLVCVIIGCKVDLIGLFGSNDLSERLKEKNNFKYLDEIDGRNLTIMDDVFDFIVLTDTHVENGDIKDLKKISAAIGANVKFVAILGDITQKGAKKDIKKVTEFISALGVPCYPVIGNHDIYSGNWSEGWKKYIGSTRYRIDGDKVTLFMLDSANAFFGKDQLDWLEKELKSTNGEVFLFTHSDFFVEDKIKIQQLFDPVERARIMSILSGKCNMVFTGHSHERVIKKFDGIKYISIEDYKSTLTYCLVHVNDGVVTYEFKKL